MQRNALLVNKRSSKMKLETIEKEYGNNIDLIRKLAWKYSNKFHIEFSEVFSECNFIFCETYRKFSESKDSKFITYLYIRLNGGMKDFIKNKIKKDSKEIKSDPFDLMDYREYNEYYDEKILFKEFIDHLSEKEIYLFKKILNSKERRLTKNKLYEELKAEGQRLTDIKKLFLDIQFKLVKTGIL